MRLAPLLLVTALLAVPLSGCLAPSSEHASHGVVVTGQPILDAFVAMNETEHLAGIPAWAATETPLEAERIGAPFSIDPESVARLEPDLVLDQPHPLVTGPSRQALETGLEPTDIEHQTLPTEPRLSTVRSTLDVVETATGTPADPHWTQLQQDLATLNASLGDATPKNAIVLFPASLVAGDGTDAHVLLELAGLTNAAAEAGLEGYRQISGEALQREGIDLVIATSTMRETPDEIAAKPMFDDTPVQDDPDRVLVLDPSQATRLGPRIADAATMVAAWAHPDLLGPPIQATVTPLKTAACSTLTVNATTPDPDADLTVTWLGNAHEPGPVTVPEVPPGHYRLHVEAQTASASSTVTQLVTVEGSQCDSA